MSSSVRGHRQVGEKRIENAGRNRSGSEHCCQRTTDALKVHGFTPKFDILDFFEI